MDPYDIGQAFDAIEDELIDSMMRNMKRHHAEEIEEGIQWTMWQAEQLKALAQYRRDNQKKFQGRFAEINKRIDEAIREAGQRGYMDQETEILKAIKEGFQGYQKASNTLQGEFFRLNDRKLEALIQATISDMKKAETAILRMADDQYRRAIFNAQVYANTGAGTYEKAVDMATKDMLSSGLNCVQYKNGARHRLKEYAEMALRTASKRAYLQGEGTKRQEWGITTVIINKRGNPCPKCLPFCGKVMIDDVWSGGSKDGISPVTGLKYPLISRAIDAGLYHPNCRDSHTTYFEGISTPPDNKYSKDEIDQIAEAYRKEQKIRHAKCQEDKFERLEKHVLDEDDRKKYSLKRKFWSAFTKTIDSVKEHKPLLLYQLEPYHRESILGRIGKMDERLREITMDYMENIKFINTNAVGIAVSRRNGIRVNLRNDARNPRGEYTSVFHEIGHCIDREAGGLSYKRPDLKKALEKDFDNVVKAFQKEYNLTQEETYSAIGHALKYNRYHSISDITGGLTKNKCKGSYGHSTSYWENENALEKEAFAHFYEAFARNDQEKIEALTQMFPMAIEEFFKLLEVN